MNTATRTETAEARTRAQASTAWIRLGMPAGMIIAAALLHLPLPVNHDAAWVLVGAERMLAGGEFGRDVVDVNPPLAWWMNLLPVLLAEATGQPVAAVFKLFVLALAAFSTGLGYGILARAGENLPLPAIAMAMLAALTLAPGYNFGQREHLMAVLAIPYLCLSVLRFNQGEVHRAVAAAAGLVGAAGFCLKPHFLAIPLAVETCLILRSASIRPVLRTENVAMLIFGAVYVAAALAAAPSYFTNVLPDVLESYGAYDSPWRIFLRNLYLTSTPLCLGLLVLCFSGRPRASAAAAHIFLAAALGAFLAAMAQRKGWPYHLYPALALGIIGLACLLAETNRKAPFQGPAATLFALACLVASIGKGPFWLAIDAAKRTGGANAVRELAAVIDDQTPERGRVFAFITSPRTVLPAVLETRRQWASSACCLHFLPAAVLDSLRAEKTPRDGTVARRENAAKQLSQIADDLARDPPHLIVVNASRYKLGFGWHEFDYLSHLENDDRFASIFRNYREISAIDSFRIFTLRMPGKTTAAKLKGPS